MPRYGDRLDLDYNTLRQFARRINVTFDEGGYQVNIVVLRGAMPIRTHALTDEEFRTARRGGEREDALNDDVVNTKTEVRKRIEDYDNLHEIRRAWKTLYETCINIMREIMAEISVDLTAGILFTIESNAENTIIDFIRYFCHWIHRFKDGNAPSIEQYIAQQLRSENPEMTREEIENEIANMRTEIDNRYQNTLQQITEEWIRLDAQGEILSADNIGDDSCTIELVEDIPDRYNDTLIFAWQDAFLNGHIRALLGSADPSSYYMENPEEVDVNVENVASVAAGSYRATWGRHGDENANYPCLDLYKNGNNTLPGRRIIEEQVEIDRGEHGANAGEDETQWQRQDNTVRILQYVASDITEVQIHAASYPPETIYEWLGGCIGVCGTDTPNHRDPHNTYDQIFGSNEAQNRTVPRDQSWLGCENQISFNIIIWNAWSLFGMAQGENPLLEFRTQDEAQLNYINPEGNNFTRQWVQEMQTALNERIAVLTQHWGEVDVDGEQLPDDVNITDIAALFRLRREGLREEFGSYVAEDALPNQIQAVDELGDFADNTARSLRAFQLACYMLLDDQNLQDNVSIILQSGVNIDRDALMDERNRWVCGPQTWALLEANDFDIIILQLEMNEIR